MWADVLTGRGVVGVRAQSTEGQVGRWAQSSALLSPLSNPTLLIVSGKTTVAGQTVFSTPSTSSALSLDLSSPISDLANPPWQALTAGPVAAYGALVPLSSSAAMMYGGDATGDSTVPVQSGSDSSWLLSLLPSSTPSTSYTPSSAQWDHVTTLWASQAPRRSLSYTASATNGTLSRAWIFGGQRPDGSGTAYNELWEMQVSVDPQTGEADPSTAVWGQWTGEGGPAAMWDGQAVLIPSSTASALPSIYFVGGVQSSSAGSTTLAPLDEVRVFTPSDSLAGGSWSTLSATASSSSGTVPSARRGHVAVDIGGGKIWVQGGRGIEEGGVFGDAALLDTKTGEWSAVEDGEVGWGRSAVMVGDTVVMAFGYGPNSALPTGLSIYSPSNDTWLDTYYPSYLASIPSSSSSSEGVPTNPKNGGASDSSNTGSTSSDSASSSPSSGSSEPASSSPSSSSDNDGSSTSSSSSSTRGSSNKDTPTSPQWTAPGSAGTQPDSSANPSGDDSSSSNDNEKDDHASKGTIAGAVVGSLVGALALAAGGAFAVKRYKDQQRYNGAGGRFTGDYDGEFGGGLAGGGAGAGGGLMAQQKMEAGYASSEMYGLGKALPSAPPSTPSGGVLGALVGFLSPRPSERYASTRGRSGGKRRFDMLGDEEDSEVWDASVRSRGEGWEQFGDWDDEKVAKEGLGEGATPSLNGRGGMGIWDGFGVGGGNSMKSSASFLGGALGGFIGLATGGAAAATAAGAGTRERNQEKSAPVQQYSSVAHPSQQLHSDPTLTPIVEWEEDDEDDDGTGTEVGGAADETKTYDSHNTHSSGTHHTTSTGLTSAEGAILSSAQKVALSRSVGVAAGVGAATAALSCSTSRPFSPAHSLYGSNFAPQPASTSFNAAGNVLSRSSSATSSLIPTSGHGHGGEGRSRGHTSSWWSRLNLQSRSSGGEIPTPTAFEAIRDPAPAPSFSMAAIAESDPFADAPSLSSHAHSRMDSSSAAPVTRHPSSATRVTTGPGEHGQFADGIRLTHGEHDRSVSSNTSEVTATSSVMEERLRGMDVVERVRTGSGGDSSCEVTPTMSGNEQGTFGRLPSLDENPFADPSSSAAPPPVTSKPTTYTPAAGSVVWAGSAVGAYSDVGSIRPFTPPPVPTLPSVIPPTPTYGALSPPSSPRKKLLGPRPLSPSTATTAFSPPPALLARSGSVKDLVAKIEGGGGAGLQLPAAPQKTKVKGIKVEHGLARKPVLYVANPDDD
ncbi:hypothetical protein JCM11251_000993 [Rhodosporidiobolus azoricus]